MAHLLKRKCFVPELKLRSKKLWKTTQPVIKNTLFRDHVSQELLPASPSYKFNTALHYSTRKLITSIGWESVFFNLNSVCLSKNQFKRSFSPGNKSSMQIQFLNTSFHEHDKDHTTENCLKPGISDRIINAQPQVSSFVEKLQNCSSVDEILTLTELAVCTKTLQVDCLSVLFSTFQEHVYKTFSFPWLFSELHLKKLQLEWNFLSDLIIGPYTADSRFQNLISYAETLLDDIPYGDCLQILHNLDYLFMDRTNSNVACKICDNCIDNLNRFSLNQLAIFSSCVQSFPKDHDLLGAIANATKMWLIKHRSQDIDLGDLCTVFLNIRHVASTDMFELGAGAIINKLASDPSNVTLEMISKINLFAKISNNECYESLVNGVLDLPLECFNVDFTNSVTFDICSNIGGNPWLCPIIEKLKAHCVTELNTADHLSMHDLVAYSLLLTQLPKSVTYNTNEKFIQLVEESDNFLLFQLMRHHSKVNFKQLPEGRELANAYHQRFVRLFASLSHIQVENLLGQDHGYLGKHLFDFLIKLKASNMQLSKDLLRTVDKHMLLTANEWDASYMKIVACAVNASERLKSGYLIAPDDLSTLAKFLCRLDFIYLMKFYKEFDMLSSKPQLSPAAKLQCFELKKRLLEIFESRLSRTDTLVPFFTSNKIVPLSKKQRHWKTAGGDTYDRLMNSLPRFLKHKDEKCCQRALKLLAVSVETYPVYQKEVFENLISFVTSSPKLLICPGIELVKILAHVGYQPDALENFSAWSQQLATGVIEHGMLDRSTLVHLAYHFSLLGMFHDNLLLNIFSLDFLTALDQELEETSIHMPDKVKYDLALLNRSVAIECPYLTVTWFSRSVLLNESKSPPTDTVHQMIESICRLTGDADYVVQSAESPYCHHIDALLYFDPSSGIIKPDDVQSGHPLPDIEKIAVLCLKPSHFCQNSDNLIGRCQADIRQLQMLGYTVVLFTQKELMSMEFQIADSLDSYVRTKINSSMHAEVFRNVYQ